MVKRKPIETDTPPSTAIILVGLPCSGKSTWAKAYVEQNPSFEIISRDAIVEAQGTELVPPAANYSDAFHRCDQKVVDGLLRSQIDNAIKSGTNVIFDMTHLTSKSRKRSLSYLQKGNYISFVKVFVLDDEEYKRRSVQREREEGKSIPHHVIDQMKMTASYDVSQDGFDHIIG